MYIWQEEIVADLIATYGQEIINMTNEIFPLERFDAIFSFSVI